MRQKKTKAAPPVPRAPLPALRYWRRARGLSVEFVRASLAERDVFVSVPLIYQWEGNDWPVALLHARALAEILDVPVEALRALPPEVRP